jgi:hypothetical protein
MPTPPPFARTPAPHGSVGNPGNPRRARPGACHTPLHEGPSVEHIRNRAPSRHRLRLDRRATHPLPLPCQPRCSWMPSPIAPAALIPSRTATCGISQSCNCPLRRRRGSPCLADEVELVLGFAERVLSLPDDGPIGVVLADRRGDGEIVHQRSGKPACSTRADTGQGWSSNGGWSLGVTTDASLRSA